MFLTTYYFLTPYSFPLQLFVNRIGNLIAVMPEGHSMSFISTILTLVIEPSGAAAVIYFAEEITRM